MAGRFSITKVPIFILLFVVVVASSTHSTDEDPIQRQKSDHSLDRIRALFTKKNRDWLSSRPAITEDLSSPVFYGVETNFLFYQIFPSNTWAAGVTTTSKPSFLFIKDPAEKMCLKSKSKLQSYGFIPAYELMLESLDPHSDVSAFYATKEGRFLHISAVGPWWAGLYSRGEWVETTDENSAFPVKRKALAEVWTADENGILVFTNERFGVENSDMIKTALESVEADNVPLGQIVSNLAPLLSTFRFPRNRVYGKSVFYTSDEDDTDTKQEKDILVVVRVNSISISEK